MEEDNITIKEELRDRYSGPRRPQFRIKVGMWMHNAQEHERITRWENNPLLDAGVQISQSTPVAERSERELRGDKALGIQVQ
jgi:hypothetical protein